MAMGGDGVGTLQLTPRICNASHASCFPLHAFNDRTEHSVTQKLSIIFSASREQASNLSHTPPTCAAHQHAAHRAPKI
ncbi:hypothetical protein FB451DRAFT_1398724 [Mycena latifolia]|nr:hypothetical protein FB451DRAFT_1398724 [Mycena latifolia]